MQKDQQGPWIVGGDPDIFEIKVSSANLEASERFVTH
jgi:hypothetical protein